MSGNNPHGHLSQPQNSSWNPLQIPSYIPRQPQLAHMSNERPMVRSPLAWHTPTPPESLYNFISANHKNLEQLNPLLPSFVRGPSPFDSMDLSLQSNRNSSSPLTKGLSASSAQQSEFGHKPPPPPPSHSQNNFPIHNLSTNSSVHHSQSMGSAPPPPPPPLSKYMNANGNDVDIQQQACGLYIRDTDRINDDYAAKMTNRGCENDLQGNMAKPVELVKECTYTNLSNKLMPASPPKKMSPPPSQQQQHQLQQQYSCAANGPNSPENNRLTHQANFNTPFNHMLSESTTSVSCLPPKCGTDLTTATVAENSCNSLSTNDSPANVTSNEDSVDSSGSRTRRKRKPNKTVRMSHDSETDENISLGEHMTLMDKQTPPPPLPTIADVSSNGNGSHSLQPELTVSAGLQHHHQQQHQQQQEQENIPYSSDNPIRSEASQRAPSVHETPSPGAEKEQLPSENRVDHRSSTESDENLNQSDMASDSQMHKSDSDDVETIDKIAEMIAKSSNSNSNCAINAEDPTSSSSNGSNGSDSNKKGSSSRTTPTHNDEDEEIDGSAVRAQHNDMPDGPPAVDNKSKPNDLTGIFQTLGPSSPNGTSQKSIPLPSPHAASTPLLVNDERNREATEEKKQSPDGKTDNVKSTFEEVEYKLEEMFAGIEDEPPAASTVPVDDATGNEVNNDLSLALSLPTTKIKNDDEDSEHKPLSSLASTSSAAQKRQHSPTKTTEPGPAKKRTRLTKKPSNKKSKGKGPSPAANSSKTIAQGNKSKGGGGGSGGGPNSGGNASGGNTNAGNNSKSVAAKVDDASLLGASPEAKHKGPYILVKSDGTINVINAPIAEDDSEKISKAKKGPYTHVDRSKIRGIHMSTLGNKYDADTADATWMCVFCKKGPHKFGLGDLFGPYIITTKCEEFESAGKDVLNDEFVSKRKKSEMFQKTPYSLPVVPSTNSNASNVNNKKKKKAPETQTSLTVNDWSSEDRFCGMSKVSDTSYEVWMHEDCAVWAPDVLLIGARIIGLESSVWSSTNYACDVCAQKGAMICCLQRGCGQKAHIPCARLSNWDLNESDFKTHCEKHVKANGNESS